MDRVEQFLSNRLQGRPVPADLRRLVEMQLDGELESDERVQPFAEIRVLSPGEVHSLAQPYEPREGELHVAETLAISRAIEGVVAHVAVVFAGGIKRPDAQPSARHQRGPSRCLRVGGALNNSGVQR